MSQSKQKKAVSSIIETMDRQIEAVLCNLPVPEFTDDQNYRLSQRLAVLSSVSDGIIAITKEDTVEETGC